LQGIPVFLESRKEGATGLNILCLAFEFDNPKGAIFPTTRPAHFSAASGMMNNKDADLLSPKLPAICSDILRLKRWEGFPVRAESYGATISR